MEWEIRWIMVEETLKHVQNTSEELATKVPASTGDHQTLKISLEHTTAK